MSGCVAACRRGNPFSSWGTASPPFPHGGPPPPRQQERMVRGGEDEGGEGVVMGSQSEGYGYPPCEASIQAPVQNYHPDS